MNKLQFDCTHCQRVILVNVDRIGEQEERVMREHLLVCKPETPRAEGWGLGRVLTHFEVHVELK
jgi:hypothetical protein